MKAGKLFYIGAVVTIVGLVLMSVPDRGCVDCDDQVTESETIPSNEVMDDIASFVEEEGND